MLSVLSFNCNKGNCNVDNIGPLLINSNADIICLQEFNQKVAISLQPYKLEEKYVYITAPFNQGWSSNVIYSRFPVIKSNYFPLEGKSRLSILARILVNNNILDIVCVHFDPGRNNIDIRNRQFTSLLNTFFSSSIPTIIIGDYNMDISEPNDGWPPNQWNSPPLFSTYSSYNLCNSSPGRFDHPFDRCLYRGVVLTDTKIIGMETIGSDHYGLLVSFTIGNIIQPKSLPQIQIPCPSFNKLPQLPRK